MRSISLVVATYNRGPAIARTLDSAMRQSRAADEIVVVDDCSTDGTGEWVASHYPQVRVLRPACNGGTSAARNFGAQHARSELLLFLDHDDELLPGAVATLAETLAAHPSARAAYADHEYRNAVTGTHHRNHHQELPSFARLRRIPTLAATPESRLYGKAMHRALLWGNLLQQPWLVYRSSFLELGGFRPDVRYCEDWELYLRVAERFPLAMTDRIVSIHHVEGGNLHLAPGQEEMHLKVMLWQWRHCGWQDLQPRAVLHRRLGQFYKCAGDRQFGEDLSEAWRCYARSLAYWPFDHVVAARTLLWLGKLILGHARRGELPETTKP